MTKKKKMKNKRNEEMLDLITSVIQKYDDLGIVADSYFIGGEIIDYTKTVENGYYPPTETRIPSALTMYCTGFVNTENEESLTNQSWPRLHIANSDPQVLLTKYKLIIESANELYIDKSLGIKQSDESVKSEFLRITGFKEPVESAVRNPIGVHTLK